MTDAACLHRRAVDLGAGRKRPLQVGNGAPAEALDAAPNQLAQNRRGGLRIPQRGVDGLDPDLQGLHQPCQPRRLAAGQLEHKAAQRRGVDHRVLQRPAEAAAEDPGVEGVVAVLHQHGSTGEVEECSPGVAELGSVDEHLALDQVPPLGIGIDRRPGVDERVEEAQRAAQAETLGTDLEHQEGPVPGGLDVHRDELGVLQRRVWAHRREVVLLGGRHPGDELVGAPWLEPQGAVGRFGHGLHPRSTTI